MSFSNQHKTEKKLEIPQSMGMGAFGPYSILLTVSVCLSVSLTGILHIKIMVNLPYVTYCDLQGNCTCRSKVTVPKERLYNI